MRIGRPSTTEWKRHLRVEIGLAVAVSLLMLLAGRVQSLSRFLQKIELNSQDLRYEIRGTMSIPKDVAILAVDDASLLRMSSRWPWPRSVYAKVIRRLKENGAKAIALDILFSEPSQRGEEDEALARAVKDAGNVFLLFHSATEQTHVRGSVASAPGLAYPLEVPDSYWIPPIGKIIAPIKPLTRVAAGYGHPMVFADPDGKFRRPFLLMKDSTQNLVYPHVALEVARFLSGVKRDQVSLGLDYAINLGDRRRIPVDFRGRYEVNFPGPSKTIPHYSFSTVYFDRTEEGLPYDLTWIANKVVIIGATAAGLYDIRPSPQSELYFGVETNAALISNLLHGIGVHEPPVVFGMLTILMLGFLVAYVLPRLAPLAGGGFATAVVLLYCAIAVFLFNSRSVMIEVVSPVLTVILAFAVVTAYRLTHEEREKRQIRDTFSVYVEKSVVDDLLSDPDRLHLGGARREVTVLFTDIVGFTSMSERLQPEEVVELLNEYFTFMNEVIFDHGGTIDKFIGDCIMVFWNAPQDQPDHARLAVQCAVAMRRALDSLQAKWQSEGKEVLDAAYGINTGEVLVGNIGSQSRVQYTVIGDHVNLASRLEGLTRQYKEAIIISEYTYQHVKDIAEVEELDTVQVKGREEPIKIYSVRKITPHRRRK